MTTRAPLRLPTARLGSIAAGAALIAAAALGATASSRADDDGPTPAAAPTFAELDAEVAALREEKVAWREIAWKSCLLEGLAEAKRQNKPVVCWVFIDRPIDDERC